MYNHVIRHDSSTYSRAHPREQRCAFSYSRWIIFIFVELKSMNMFSGNDAQHFVEKVCSLNWRRRRLIGLLYVYKKSHGLLSVLYMAEKDILMYTSNRSGRLIHLFFPDTCCVEHDDYDRCAGWVGGKRKYGSVFILFLINEGHWSGWNSPK